MAYYAYSNNRKLSIITEALKSLQQKLYMRKKYLDREKLLA